MEEKEDNKAKQPSPPKPMHKKKRQKGIVTQKLMSFRCDEDLLPYLKTKRNKGRYINTLIRKDRDTNWGLSDE
ncbi:MAG: hypothetical protein PUF37_00925 [Prevotellaceae bacterium]|nr:hypothetical protein [Prevotellaceae bacterium]